MRAGFVKLAWIFQSRIISFTPYCIINALLRITLSSERHYRVHFSILRRKMKMKTKMKAKIKAKMKTKMSVKFADFL